MSRGKLEAITGFPPPCFGSLGRGSKKCQTQRLRQESRRQPFIRFLRRLGRTNSKRCVHASTLLYLGDYGNDQRRSSQLYVPHTRWQEPIVAFQQTIKRRPSTLNNSSSENVDMSSCSCLNLACRHNIFCSTMSLPLFGSSRQLLRLRFHHTRSNEADASTCYRSCPGRCQFRPRHL
jgi:hypothetical protein